MIEQNNKHYYIFEPTLLRNGHIVIPVFFYHNGPNLMAKCAVPRIIYTKSPPTIFIQMPSDPSFDLHALKSLNVMDFDQIYDKIKISGLSIGQLCSHQIWGELMFCFFGSLGVDRNSIIQIVVFHQTLNSFLIHGEQRPRGG
jgi:hypothetical protein